MYFQRPHFCHLENLRELKKMNQFMYFFVKIACTRRKFALKVSSVPFAKGVTCLAYVFMISFII